MPKMEQRASATRAEILARKQLVDLVAAADYLNCSVKTVRRRIAEGLPAYRVGPRAIRVDLADLDALMRPIGGAA